MTEAIHINVRFQAKPGKQAELARRMAELRPDVEALEGRVVTVDSDDETVLYFIETFPDQAAMDADMKTPLVAALVADLGELTVHGTGFRIDAAPPLLGKPASCEVVARTRWVWLAVCGPRTRWWGQARPRLSSTTQFPLPASRLAPIHSGL